jgi:hypothetical protein
MVTDDPLLQVTMKDWRRRRNRLTQAYTTKKLRFLYDSLDANQSKYLSLELAEITGDIQHVVNRSAIRSCGDILVQALYMLSLGGRLKLAHPLEIHRDIGTTQALRRSL